MATKKSASPDVGAVLDRAQMVSTTLKAATEKLNGSLKQAEIEIAKLSLGVTAAVEVERYEEPKVGDDVVRQLRFGKDNREWKLLWETGLSDDPDSWETTPLLNASREVRMLAVPFLPLLVQKLVETAEEQIGEVKAKADEVEKLVETVKAGIPF
jgi:hypothetical protein